jgi:hypothetical protein
MFMQEFTGFVISHPKKKKMFIFLFFIRSIILYTTAWNWFSQRQTVEMEGRGFIQQPEEERPQMQTVLAGYID